MLFPAFGNEERLNLSSDPKFLPIGWTNLKLICTENRMIAFINNKKGAEIKDNTYKNGMAGIGSSFYPVRFDNFSIKDASLDK